MAKQKTNIWFVVSMILIGVLAVGGIFGLITFGKDKSCSSNSDCKNGQVCSQGKCYYTGANPICGGIGGIKCSTGFQCALDNPNIPDSFGTCQHIGDIKREPTVMSIVDINKYEPDLVFLGDFEDCAMGEKEQIAMNTFGQALTCYKGMPPEKMISVFYVTRYDNPYKCSLWIQDCISDGGCIFDREYNGIKIYNSKQLEQGLKNERWCSGANDLNGFLPFEKVRIDITLSREALERLKGLNRSQVINNLILERNEPNN